MKNGMSLTELAAELERQQDAKKDLVADTRSMEVEVVTDEEVPRLLLNVGEDAANRDLQLTNHAFRQMGQRLNMPAKYADMLRDDHPALLQDSLNRLLTERPERRMVRCLDGTARAFLSDRYRPLDNHDLASAVLPTLQELQPEAGLSLESMQITERRMYIKAVFPRIEGEVRKGDVVQSGVIISNSEIGDGSLKVEPLIFRLVCLNGMVMPDRGVKKYHTGGRLGAGDVDEVYDVFADDTLRADDEATWLKLRDVVRAAMSREGFEQALDRMREVAARPIEGDIVAAVEVVQRRFNLTDGHRSGILRHLTMGADLSQWGLVNAVTAYSQTVEDYDEATDLEVLGGRVLGLDGRAWKEVAEAA